MTAEDSGLESGELARVSVLAARERAMIVFR
jgi:hypothetical protein